MYRVHMVIDLSVTITQFIYKHQLLHGSVKQQTYLIFQAAMTSLQLTFQFLVLFLFNVAYIGVELRYRFIK